MKRRVLTGVILLVFLFGVGMGVGGYVYGNSRGKKIGIAEGEKRGYQQGIDVSAPTLEQVNALKEYEKLINDYNTLVNDYNQLRTVALNYINQTQFQARQPITCNTYSYSYSTTTNCY